jgi:hypothetical protein
MKAELVTGRLSEMIALNRMKRNKPECDSVDNLIGTEQRVFHCAAPPAHKCRVIAALWLKEDIVAVY